MFYLVLVCCRSGLAGGMAPSPAERCAVFAVFAPETPKTIPASQLPSSRVGWCSLGVILQWENVSPGPAASLAFYQHYTQASSILIISGVFVVMLMLLYVVTLLRSDPRHDNCACIRECVIFVVFLTGSQLTLPRLYIRCSWYHCSLTNVQCSLFSAMCNVFWKIISRG